MEIFIDESDDKMSRIFHPYKERFSSAATFLRSKIEEIILSFFETFFCFMLQ